MTKSSPHISVVIPAFNAEEFIVHAIESVVRQSYSNIEIIVVDDGSHDGTRAAVNSFGDPRIRVITQGHHGVVSAANRGFDESRGEYVARVDSDDVMMPGRLAAQLGFLESHRDTAVCGTAYELFGAASGYVRMPLSDRACRQRLLLATCFAQSSVMLRKSVLDKNSLRYRAHTDGLGEDYQLWCEISEHGRMANLPMLGLRYRVHPHQASTIHWNRLVSNYIRISTEHAARAGRRPLSPADLMALTKPMSKTTGDTSATNPSMTGVILAVARAVRRAPGVETTRFTARCAFERFSELRALDE